MGLKGYTRQPGRRNGGIVRIAVADIDAIASVEFDRVTGNVSAVELSEGKSFALYNFKEDSACFTEKTETSAGFLLVSRELSFTLERLDENEKNVASELLKKSARGYILIALNGCGTSLLLGYSRRLGPRFPMKIKKTEASTGSAPENTAGETITFFNEDVEKAPVYTGIFPEVSH